MKPSSTWLNILTACKCKSVRIHDQEHSEMIQGISSWVLVPIKSLTLVKNMPPRFNGIRARTFEVLVGKES